MGAAYTVVANGLAVAGGAAATAKIMGFRSGGRTSGSGGSLLRGADVQVGPSGRLVDSEGFAVAGVVHENVYVIPAWLRQDPTVVRMEEYLEARRLRGYAQCGGRQ